MALLRPLVLLVALLGPCLTAQELITNGGFESGGNGWQPNGNFYIGNLSNPRSGSWYAYLSTSTGSPGNSLYGTLRQTFTIPSNITSASLRFYYSITSTDTASNADLLTVFFEGTGTQHTFSNNNTTSGYASYTFDLTSYAGQTLTVQFLGTTNSTNPTVFRIDDVSATYVPAPSLPAAPSNLQAIGSSSTILLTWQDNANNETGFEVLRGQGDPLFLWTTVGANVNGTQDNQAFGSVTCYRVRAKNTAGVSNTSNQGCASSLDRPTLLQPTDGMTTTATSVFLSWQSTQGANRYRIEIGTACNNLTNFPETPDTSYTLAVSPGTYAWRVLAANTTFPGVSAPSQCRTFTIGNTPTSPQASFTWTPSAPTTSTPVQFSDTSTGTPTIWSWAFGDGATASVQHPAHTYASSRTYTVTLTVSNTGGSDTDTSQVTVGTTVIAPVANFSYNPTSPAPGQPVSFTDTSTNNPTSWAWDFDNNGTVESNQQHPTATFATAGTYTVKLTATNTAGSNSKTRTLTISTVPQAPVADFTFSPTTLTTSTPVQFSDTSTNNPTSWGWDFDNNGTTDSTLQHPTATFATAATYTIKLTATNTAGSDSKTRTITVTTASQAPAANFTFSPTTPTISTPVHFTDTSTNNPTSWAWDFQNNGTTDSTLQHPVHTYPTSGTYSIKLTVSNTAGSNSTAKTITVTNGPQAPVANFTVTPSNPAVGQSVSFTDTSTGTPTSWSWTFDDGGTATTKNASHAFATARTYSVKLTVTNSAGSNTRTKNITISPVGCTSCITVDGHVIVPNQIAIRGTNTDAMRVVFHASNGSARAASIQDSGHYEITELRPGQYDIEVVIASQHLRQPAVARISRVIERSLTLDIAFPRPLVLVHGWRSGPETWDEWLGELGDRMVIAPDYGNENGVGDATGKVYRELEQRLHGLFTATPQYDVIAHSMGGVVSRYLQQQYANTPIANAMHSLVTLGSPHLGTNCFVGEAFDLGRGDRAADDATRLLQRTRVGAIAGTNPNLTMAPGGFDLFVKACTGDCQPHDGLVPVDSALRMPIGRGQSPRLLDGFVVPYNHFELASGKTTWLLNQHILPFFAGAPFTRGCGIAMCGATCVGGSGLTSTGACTINDGQTRTGVRLLWTRDPFVGIAVVATAPASCRGLNPAVGNEAGFHIYRAFTPIKSLAAAERIAFVNRDTLSYFDPTGTPQHHYLITIATSTGHEPQSAHIKVSVKQRASRH